VSAFTVMKGSAANYIEQTDGDIPALDGLVEATPLSFREAHRVVGALVARSLARGKLPEDVTLPDLEAAAAEVLTERVDFSRVDLHDAVDARKALERRQVAGGPAPDRVKAVVDDARTKWADDTKVHARARQKLEAASARLRQAARQIAEG
jgi:argininosuccinate lyase